MPPPHRRRRRGSDASTGSASSDHSDASGASGSDPSSPLPRVPSLAAQVLVAPDGGSGAPASAGEGGGVGSDDSDDSPTAAGKLAVNPGSNAVTGRRWKEHRVPSFRSATGTITSDASSGRCSPGSSSATLSFGGSSNSLLGTSVEGSVTGPHGVRLRRDGSSGRRIGGQSRSPRHMTQLAVASDAAHASSRGDAGAGDGGARDKSGAGSERRRSNEAAARRPRGQRRSKGSSASPTVGQVRRVDSISSVSSAASRGRRQRGARRRVDAGAANRGSSLDRALRRAQSRHTNSGKSPARVARRKARGTSHHTDATASSRARVRDRGNRGRSRGPKSDPVRGRARQRRLSRGSSTSRSVSASSYSSSSSSGSYSTDSDSSHRRPVAGRLSQRGTPRPAVRIPPTELSGSPNAVTPGSGKSGKSSSSPAPTPPSRLTSAVTTTAKRSPLQRRNLSRAMTFHHDASPSRSPQQAGRPSRGGRALDTGYSGYGHSPPGDAAPTRLQLLRGSTQGSQSMPSIRGTRGKPSGAHPRSGRGGAKAVKKKKRPVATSHSGGPASAFSILTSPPQLRKHK